MDSLSREEEAALRLIGRRSLEKAAKAGSDKSAPGISRRTMKVVADNGDGTLDLNSGSDEDPEIQPGIRMLSGCAGAKVDDIVVVETIDHVSYATGVVLHGNPHYVTGKVFIGSTVLQSSAQGGQILFSSPGNFVESFGREFDVLRDFVIMYNGDGNAVQYCTINPEIREKSGVLEIVARTSKSIGEGQMFRVNWIVYLGE